MSTSWSIFITVISLGLIFGCLWLIFWTRKRMPNEPPEGASLGHNFDGIEELNNPMPKWWIWLFYATIVFSLGYFVIYPGLGTYGAFSGWTSHNQWEKEVQRAEQTFRALFTQYAGTPIEELVRNEEALQMGQRLFANHCAACHGSDGQGSAGFPNLTDNAWLYGGTPEEIKTSIMSGRKGNMPPMEVAIGGEQATKEVTEYVLSLSGAVKVDSALAAKGEEHYKRVCFGCHGPDAKGNTLLGAPNLTDTVWLYGGTRSSIKHTIKKGRQGIMPAHEDKLGNAKVHIIAAYVYSLSNK